MEFCRTDGKDKDFDLQLKRAECPVKVAEIAERTIRAGYPHYNGKGQGTGDGQGTGMRQEG